MIELFRILLELGFPLLRNQFVQQLTHFFVVGKNFSDLHAASTVSFFATGKSLRIGSEQYLAGKNHSGQKIYDV